MILPISAMTQEELLHEMGFSNNSTIREIAAKFQDFLDGEYECTCKERYKAGYAAGAKDLLKRGIT